MGGYVAQGREDVLAVREHALERGAGARGPGGVRLRGLCDGLRLGGEGRHAKDDGGHGGDAYLPDGLGLDALAGDRHGNKLYQAEYEQADNKSEDAHKDFYAQ